MRRGCTEDGRTSDDTNSIFDELKSESCAIFSRLSEQYRSSIAASAWPTEIVDAAEEGRIGAAGAHI